VARVRSDFRYSFTSYWTGETLRAFTFFGALLLVLVAIAVQLSLRELSLKVLTERLDLGRHEAERIAARVEALGSEGTGIDFSRIRANREDLQRFIGQRISERVFISYVEVRDRFGVRQLRVMREGSPLPRVPGSRLDGVLPEDWPSVPVQEVSVPLQRAEGEIRLGVAHGALLDELARLRNSLRFKVAVAGIVALVVLIAGFFYVLYLIRKNQRLEQARQSAGRASYVGLLASGLAHEIRNPLNAMNMNLQMLEEELQVMPELDNSEYAELLDSTKREIKRLERLVNNFLAYARPARPRFESKDLNAIVSDVLRFLEADFKQSNVEVTTDLAQLLPTTEIDETLFKQALINLLVNARQVLASGGNGRVLVRSRAGSSGEVVLEISDNGPGIAADLEERIFEVFYSSRGGGTGLGLPIARQIVERHGGRIEVDSDEGQGTTFRIRLPRRHGATVQRAASAERG